MREHIGIVAGSAEGAAQVAPADALFVGDDHRRDVVGAQNAGLRPVLLEGVVPKSRRDHLVIPNLTGTIALLTEASL